MSVPKTPQEAADAFNAQNFKPGENTLPPAVTLAMALFRKDGSIVKTQNFVAPVTTGATTVAVVFPEKFTSTPIISGAIIAKANSDDDNTPVVSIDSLTDSGFNANLQGPAPAGVSIHVSAHL